MLAEIVRSGKVFVSDQSGYYRQVGTSTALASYRSENEYLIEKILLKDPTQQFLIMRDFSRTVSGEDSLAWEEILQSLIDLIAKTTHLQYLSNTGKLRVFGSLRSVLSRVPFVYYALRRLRYPSSSIPVLLKSFVRSRAQ